MSKIKAYALAIAIFLSGCGDKYVAGVDYYLINPPVERLSKDSGVEVVEVFWYGCSSCYNFEPKFAPWLNDHKDDIALVRMPAPLNDDWTKHAKLYWSAKEIGLGDEFSDLVYKEIHINRNSLLTISQLYSFLENHKINPEDFNLAYNSRQVNSRIEFTENYLKRVGLRTVPALIIDGKYLVLENNQPEKMLEVASYLVKISK